MEIKFDKNQLAAVKHINGPMMVLAGPGSGKTAVITGRLENMIINAGISPGEILVVTFSKKAAKEMEGRFIKKNLNLNKIPAFGTFHSIFYSILKNESRAGLDVVSQKQKYDALRCAVESLYPDAEADGKFYSSIFDEISRVKGSALDINGYESLMLPPDIFRLVFYKYQSFLKSNSLIDFDDMLILCLRLLYKNCDILKKWQSRFKFILIDEFQDINMVQYEIIRLLSKESRNVFIVGDDDQSIYGFRGARPELMKRFLKDFKEAKTVILDTNYRSTPQIVSAAKSVIKENENRFSKNIKSSKSSGSAEVLVLSFPDIKSETDAVIGKIKELYAGGLPFCEIALLFRNNADMEYMSKRLCSAGIPISTKENAQSPYSHFISRDILSYLRAAYMYPDCLLSDILLIMNRPSRYISREALYLNKNVFSSIKLFYGQNQRMTQAAEKFENDICRLRELSPYGAVKYIRNVIGYDNYLKENSAADPAVQGEYKNVLSFLETEAAKYKTQAAWVKAADEKLLNENTENEKNSKESSVKRDCVNLLTIHASKGLEWEAVFIPMCCDRIIPGKNTGTLFSLEEERRVLYVAMTRAKSFLQISWPEKLKDKEAKPSRFLENLKKD